MTDRDRPETASPGRLDALAALTRKELRQIVRDGRFRAVGIVVTCLLVASLAFGFRHARSLQTERQAAQSAADEQWRGQGEKNPHVAAHYGTYVFKPAGLLRFVDPGVDPYLGAYVKLEAHDRNAFQGAGARDATALARFASLNAASVLQLLVPLLVIGLAFSSWSGERERGSLRQLVSVGARMHVLIGGKVLGPGLALAAVVFPAAAVGTLAAWLVAGGEGSAPTAWTRLLAMAAAYSAYCGVFLFGALHVSGAASSSRLALVILLGFWFATALVVPRAAADLAARLSPAASGANFERGMRESLKRGLPGGPTRDDRVGTLTAQLLEKEGFTGTELLMDPALLASMELQAEALYESEVIDHHFGRLAEAVDGQERWYQWMSMLSPVVAIRSLSMSLAGTDHSHHRHFSDAAERHRRALVDMLNRAIGEQGAADAWSYKAGRELWEKAPALRYEVPGLGFVLRQQLVSLLALAAWLTLSVFASWRTATRMPVV